MSWTYNVLTCGAIVCIYLKWYIFLKWQVSYTLALFWSKKNCNIITKCSKKVVFFLRENSQFGKWNDFMIKRKIYQCKLTKHNPRLLSGCRRGHRTRSVVGECGRPRGDEVGEAVSHQVAKLHELETQGWQGLDARRWYEPHRQVWQFHHLLHDICEHEIGCILQSTSIKCS